MSKDVNKEGNAGGKSRLDEMKEIARKYGIEVTDGADRGIRAIGILGGISWKHQNGPRNVSGRHEQLESDGDQSLLHE